MSLARRHFLATSAWAGAGALPSRSFAQRKRAQFKRKLGTDLPVTHSVNLRLTEAIATISTEIAGRMLIDLFPDNQLGGDADMLSQLRFSALQLANGAVGNHIRGAIEKIGLVPFATVRENGFRQITTKWRHCFSCGRSAWGPWWRFAAASNCVTAVPCISTGFI